MRCRSVMTGLAVLCGVAILAGTVLAGGGPLPQPQAIGKVMPTAQAMPAPQEQCATCPAVPLACEQSTGCCLHNPLSGCMSGLKCKICSMHMPKCNLPTLAIKHCTLTIPVPHFVHKPKVCYSPAPCAEYAPIVPSSQGPSAQYPSGQ